MRRHPHVLRTGLAVTAATVLLTACGGGSDKQATGTSASTSSAPTTTSGAASEFCTQATSTFNELAPAFSGGGSDPAKLGPILAMAAAKVHAIQPPADISADWAKLAGGLDQFAAAFASASAGAQNSASASAFKQRNDELLAQLSGPATNVRAYMTAHCGLPSTAPGSSAPTS
jgi:hypothetical protein